MYPATLRGSVRVNLKTSNGSKICQVTLRNLPWDEWVGKISLICSWEEIPFRYNFIFWEQSVWDRGCSVAQRQVKKKQAKLFRDCMSEHPQVQFASLLSLKALLQRVTSHRHKPSHPGCCRALYVLARFQQAFLYQIRYLLQWTSAVGPREAPVKKTAFQVQRTGLRRGVFCLLHASSED